MIKGDIDTFRGTLIWSIFNWLCANLGCQLAMGCLEISVKLNNYWGGLKTIYVQVGPMNHPSV